jgi:hypothetical protein
VFRNDSGIYRSTGGGYRNPGGEIWAIGGRHTSPQVVAPPPLGRRSNRNRKEGPGPPSSFLPSPLSPFPPFLPSPTWSRIGKRGGGRHLGGVLVGLGHPLGTPKAASPPLPPLYTEGGAPRKHTSSLLAVRGAPSTVYTLGHIFGELR